MDYIIRKCELKDIPGITETVTTSWKETYKGLVPDDYLDNLDSTMEERTKNARERFLNGEMQFVLEIDGKIVGFNNRQYDNHLIYARAFRAYSNASLYDLSQNIINFHKGYIGEAYDISYTDVYDFCTEKKSLKKWEVALGIHHQEMGIPWDEPVPDDMIDIVMDYCENDVRATEAVFLARKGDFAARKIQVELVKMLHGDIKVTVNDTTNTLSKRIIFGKEI